MHNFFGIIPARKNSKGIKRKNLQKIGSKPMLQFSFESASKSKMIDYFILSSNDSNAIDLANKLNIVAPFLRPNDISLDNSKTSDVIMHALEWYKDKFSDYPRNVILLQPTSPFRTEEDIDQAINKYIQNDSDSLISVCKTTQHPSDCVEINDQGKINLLNIEKDKTKVGRQAFKDIFFIDGGIYISSVKRFLKEKTTFDSNSDYYLVKKSHGIDIDDLFDLETARALYNHNKNGNTIF
jgi:CMP-N,N'-diacetyllegionaminic acid synthase